MEKDESRYHNLREWKIIHVAQINKNTKLLNIKCTAASVGFISAIWTTFFRGCLGSAIGKCSARRRRRIDQSLHGVGSTPGKKHLQI